MPCFCKNKVDRLYDKVQCIICNQFMHAKCYNINKSEILLIKGTFKCKLCLFKRRSSLSTTPVNAIMPALVAGSVVANLNSASAEKSVSADGIDNSTPTRVFEKSAFAVSNSNTYANLNSAIADKSVVAAVDECDDIDNSSPTRAFEKSADSNSNTYAKPVLGTVVVKTNDAAEVSYDARNNLPIIDLANECTPVTETVTLQLLMKELISLRQSNNSLCANIELLTANNSILSSKVESMCLTIEKLELALSNNSNNPADVGILKQQSIKSKKKTKKVSSLNSNNLTFLPTSLSNNCEHLDAENNAGFAEDSVAVDVSSSHVLPNTASSNKLLFSDVTRAAAVNNDNTVQPSNNVIKNSVVVGVCNNNELEVIGNKKWLHLSSFKPTVSVDDIISYVEKHTGIDKSLFVCYKLIKKDVDISTLNFVNFKLGISARLVDNLLDPKVWPANILIRPFRFLEKPVAPVTQKKN